MSGKRELKLHYLFDHASTALDEQYNPVDPAIVRERIDDLVSLYAGRKGSGVYCRAFQARRCSMARRVAALREETPSFGMQKQRTCRLFLLFTSDELGNGSGYILEAHV